MTTAICAMPARAHLRLVVEDAAEVVAVGKHLVLVRQVRPARVDQVDAGQPVLRGDLLRAQVLLHRHRIVGAALHGGVVRHHHDLLPRDPADAGDHPGRRRVAAVEPVRRRRADLEERAPGVEQPRHPVPRQHLAARRVPRRRLRARRPPPPPRPPPRSRPAPRDAPRGWRGTPPSPATPARRARPSQRPPFAELGADVADLAVEEEADHRADQHEEAEEQQVLELEARARCG